MNPTVKCAVRREPVFEIYIYVCYDQNGIQLSTIDEFMVDWGLDYYLEWATGEDCKGEATTGTATTIKPSTQKPVFQTTGKSLCSSRKKLSQKSIYDLVPNCNLLNSSRSNLEPLN